MSSDTTTMTTTVTKQVGCWDCCGVTGRPERDFDPSNITALSEYDTFRLLLKNSTSIEVWLTVQVIVNILWYLMDGIPGFVLYDGTQGAINCYTNGMWWRAIELVAMVVGASSVYFKIAYVRRTNLIEKGVARASSFLTLYIVVLVLAALANLAHGIVNSLDLASNCSGTFCAGYAAFFWVFMFALYGLFFLQLWLVVRCVAYKRNLDFAVKYYRIDMTVAQLPTPPPAYSHVDPAAAPTPAMVKGSVSKRSGTGTLAAASAAAMSLGVPQTPLLKAVVAEKAIGGGPTIGPFSSPKTK
jgi:hypothetical protein